VVAETHDPEVVAGFGGHWSSGQAVDKTGGGSLRDERIGCRSGICPEQAGPERDGKVFPARLYGQVYGRWTSRHRGSGRSEWSRRT
jgi:hypothetical protein